MKLILPIPPSINHYYRNDEQGGRKINKRGKEYRFAVKLAATQARAEKIEGAVSVIVYVICPDYRRRDLDNMLKCLLDAITHAGLIEDDSMIVELSMYKHKPDSSNKSGQAIVNIDKMPQDDIEIRKAGAWII